MNSRTSATTWPDRLLRASYMVSTMPWMVRSGLICARTDSTVRGQPARRGNARAEALLGYMYEHGLGVPQSWPAAVDYYLLAAEQGDATGQYLLGLMYDKGFGVSRDIVQAYKWLELAAAHGPKNNREYFLRLRDAVASKMTRAQLDLGQQLALEWSMTRTGR